MFWPCNLFFFFPTTDFSTSLSRFSRDCHTTRCALKCFISYMDVHTCPLKIWGVKTPIFSDLRTQNRHFEPTHSLMRGKSGNLKQQGQSLVRWVRSYQTWRVSPPTSVPLEYGVGQVNCLILGVLFRSQAIQWRQSWDRGSKGRCHGNQFWD